MEKIDKGIKIRPLGFLSILCVILFFFTLFCIFDLLIQNDINQIAIISAFLVAFLFSFIFLLPIFGQKIVVQNKKMFVYLCGRKKWTFDLTVPHEAEFGFYYQDKLSKLLHGGNRKFASVQVKNEKQKVSFPVGFYSTNQIRTIVFILNNSVNDKFKDCRLNGQETYLINAHLVRSVYKADLLKQKHCEFCMKKFIFGNESEKLYATKNLKYWICEKCFEDFKDMFKFKLLKNKQKNK